MQSTQGKPTEGLTVDIAEGELKLDIDKNLKKI